MDSPSQMSQPLTNGTEVPIEEVETPVLIVGGGPVGMILAYMLAAHHQQPCMLIEKNSTTTTYPKMEFSNGRTMEIYRQIGVGDQLRQIGVPEKYDVDELWTTSLAPGGKTLVKWERDAPAVVRQNAKAKNDGTFAREPYFRCHQITVERWLKDLISKEDDVKSLWGWRFVTLTENADGVVSEIMNSEGKRMRVKSQYVIGCDGGGSLVRKNINLESKRRSLDMDVTFVHFKSRDLKTLFSQGHYWHCMLLNGTIIVNQDEKETWTLHTIRPGGFGIIESSPEDIIAETVGGLLGPHPIKIDEVYVKGVWKSEVAIADSFLSAGGRVILAGDSAHQLSPAGGHGLSSGVADVFNLSWKLAATLKGWGGEHLLDSYTPERRPVAFRNLEMAERATTELILPAFGLAAKRGIPEFLAETESGQAARGELTKHLESGSWLHNQDGIYMGYRYSDSPAIVHDNEVPEPEVTVQGYLPTTWPGGRPPHVFLEDGVTSIHDLFGKEFSIVDFTEHGNLAESFLTAAKTLNVPVKKIHLPTEKHVRNIWERDVVLVRPDGHVAWRLPSNSAAAPEGIHAVEEILKIAVGAQPN